MARVTLLPVNLNSAAMTGGTWLTSTTPGYDSGSPGGSITAWAGQLGVQFVNNGMMFLGIANGLTATAASILVGQKAGGGVEPAFSTFQVTIGASYPPGWLLPVSPQQFNQQDTSQYTAAPGGLISGPPSGLGMTCIDFTNVTTLAVRLYQLIPVQP